MVDILVHPKELIQISDLLSASAKIVDSSLHSIDQDIHSLKSDQFLGYRADAVQEHYASRRAAMLSAKKLVEHFARDLLNAAIVFEKADRSEYESVLLDSGGALKLAIFADVQKYLSFPLIEAMVIPILPIWLRGKLEKIFNGTERLKSKLVTFPEGNVSAVGQDKNIPDHVVDSDLTDDQAAVLQSQGTVTQEEFSRSQQIDASNVDTSFNVPIKSQGSLYKNAGCSLVSVSMVLDYYHAQNSANRTASAEEILSMLDQGDGIPGKGISLSKLTDELGELGYRNVTPKVGADYDVLRDATKDGPVIVIAGVRIVGPGTVNSEVPRAIVGSGNTIHAMVVTGVGENQVNINDPWSGQQMKMTRGDFEKMWIRGQNSYYSIRP